MDEYFGAAMYSPIDPLPVHDGRQNYLFEESRVEDCGYWVTVGDH